VEDVSFKPHLEEAARRVGAIAKVHDQLFQTSDIERLDVGRYIEAICKDLDSSFAISDIHAEAEGGIVISADRAISAALIVNELIANSIKHADPGHEGDQIWVRVASVGADKFSVSVRADGATLPPDFQPEKTKGLGMRIVTSLTEQLNGTLTFATHNPGAEFVLTAPNDL
jgi:two-component sensor histidine kinase